MSQTKTTSGFKWNPEYLSTSRGKMGEWIRDENTQDEGKLDNTIFDRSSPLVQPTYKVSWGHNWEVKIRHEVDKIDLNKLDLIHRIKSKLSDPSVLFNVEIHVLWISYLPANLFPGTIKIGTDFTQGIDIHSSTLQYHNAPAAQYTHSIFFPGHAISLRNGIIPWAITIDTSDIDVTPDYVIGKCYIKICGTSGDIPEYETEKLSKMIALVPESEPIAGITYSNPRLPSTSWTRGFIKRGASSRANMNKIMALQKLGVNTEGLALLGNLGKVLKKISSEDLNSLNDIGTKKKIAELVKGYLANMK